MAEAKKLTEIKDEYYKQAFYLLLANIINNAQRIGEQYAAPGSKGQKAYEARVTIHLTQKIIESAEEILVQIKESYTNPEEATIPREMEKQPGADE